MGAGTESYKKPEYGSLAGAMGEKLGSAIQLAAGARKRQNDELQELEELGDNRTDEEEERYQELKAQKEEQGNAFFMKKALGTEFGGDFKRRTMGFFQTNPEEQNDPALDKQKRFDALVAAQPAKVEGVKQGELDLSSAGYQEQGVVGKLSADIAEKFAILSAKVDQLRKKEDEDKTPSVVVKLAENIKGVGTFFTKNNQIEEQQTKVAEETLAEQIKAKDAAESSAIENRGEGTSDSAGTNAIDNRRKKGKKKKGLFGTALDFGLGLLSKRRGRRGGRNRMPRMSKGRQYSNPIGPLGRGSSQPWARARGGAGMGGFSPRMRSRVLPGRKGLASGGVLAKNPEKPPEKLASGGVLDNPTAVGGASDQAIIPKNKLESAVKTDPENVKKSSPFAKALQLPTMAAGAIMMGTASNVINHMGGIGKIFRPVVQKLFEPAAAAFGIPGSLVSAFFGGPANAKTTDTKGGGGKGKSSTQNSSASSTTGGGATGFMAPGMISNGGSVDGYRITSPFGPRNTGIPGASRNHQGVDYGVPQGTAIALKKPGKVIETTVPAMGNLGAIFVKHDDGTRSRYLHMSKIAVTPGQLVTSGTVIGKTGGQPGTPGAGPTNGAHLHFEYYPSSTGGPVDGSRVASSYFTVGGTIDQGAPAAPPVAADPAAAPVTPADDTTASGDPIILPAVTAPDTSRLPKPRNSAKPISTSPVTPAYPTEDANNPYMGPAF